MKMKGIVDRIFIFDFDGTLVDSMSTFSDVMTRVLDEYGVSYEADIVKVITPLGYRGTAEYFRDLGINESVDDLVKYMQSLAVDEYTHRIRAKAGVIDTLVRLKEKGACLNVLTASPHSALDPCLKRLGMWDIFINVWSSDDFGLTKSDPKIYYDAATRLGAQTEQIIFVDDNLGAIRTAKRAGVTTVGIFDDSSRDCVLDMQDEADYYVYTFDKIFNLL